MTDFDTRLADLGLSLPDAPAPAANYVPFVQSGAMLYVSGQICQDENGLILGKLGADLDTAAGAKAAERCWRRCARPVAAICPS